MKKYIVEFIGTFFLMFIICAASMKAGAMAPLAIGSILMVMVYAGGYISGAHYNPAVSLAVFIRGKMSMPEMIIYWIVQIAGAAVAAILAKTMFNFEAAAPSTAGVEWALIVELIGTFALAYVVLNVATSDKTSGNDYYGLAIGFTVTALAFSLGPISGGAFNPAVAIGQSIYGAFAWSQIWVYLVGCFGGGLIAGLAFKVLTND